MNATNQFKKVKTPSGKVALEAYCAVAFNDGNNVAYCCATEEILREVWERKEGVPLIGEGVQHVWIIKAE